MSVPAAGVFLRTSENGPDLVLKGVDIQVRRTVDYMTEVLESASRREVRAQFASLPRLRYRIRVNFLRTDAATDELHALAAFYMAARGKWGTFVFVDPNPDSTLITAGIMDSHGCVNCRFDMDAVDFDREMNNLWAVKTLDIISVVA